MPLKAPRVSDIPLIAPKTHTGRHYRAISTLLSPLALISLVICLKATPRHAYAQESQDKKDIAILLGVIFEGMTKEEVLGAQGYPGRTFKHQDYDVWYYKKLYNAVMEKPLKNVYILFKDDEVAEVKLGHFEVSPPKEI